MKFVAASIVLAATVSVALAEAAPAYIPYGYRYLPYNGYNGYNAYNGYNGYYPFPAIPALPAARFAAPLPAAIPAPVAAIAPAPAAAGYKSESFATPEGSKTEIRDDAGQYSLSYTTAEGLRVSERSYLKSGPEGYIPVKEGTYEYTSPEGVPVSYGYKADENGYVVKGSPLPLGPVPAKA